MARIYYFASANDHAELTNFVKSLGVNIYPAKLESGASLDDKSGLSLREWHLGFIPIEQIHQHRANPGYSDQGNALIDWTRARIEGRDLIAGSIEWEDFSPTMCTLFGINRDDVIEIGKVFRKIQRWIRKNYVDLDRDHFWFAPEAAEMRTRGGYRARSDYSKDTIFEQIVLDENGNVVETRRLNDISEFEDRDYGDTHLGLRSHTPKPLI